jgi:hypothetical protein
MEALLALRDKHLGLLHLLRVLDHDWLVMNVLLTKLRVSLHESLLSAVLSVALLRSTMLGSLDELGVLAWSWVDLHWDVGSLGLLSGALHLLWIRCHLDLLTCIHKIDLLVWGGNLDWLVNIDHLRHMRHLLNHISGLLVHDLGCLDLTLHLVWNNVADLGLLHVNGHSLLGLNLGLVLNVLMRFVHFYQ